MTNERSSPFDKKTLASDSIIRSEVKDSRILLLASKKKHLENLTKSPRSQFGHEENRAQIQIDSEQKSSASVRRRFSEYQKDKEIIYKSKKSILSRLNLLYCEYKNNLNWYDNFSNFINEKNMIKLEDSIPKALNSDGEILLCETIFWILLIKFNINKVNQKLNLQRVINLFNECLRYELQIMT